MDWRGWLQYIDQGILIFINYLIITNSQIYDVIFERTLAKGLEVTKIPDVLYRLYLVNGVYD